MTSVPAELVQLCPTPPHWTVSYECLVGLPELAALRDCPQDPVFHGEGDVLTHTFMTAKAMAALPGWRARSPEDRVRLFTAALLHDIGKPACTRVEADGRITSHGHSRAGERAARRLLWQLGAPILWRESVASLVRFHQLPFWALEQPDAATSVRRVSVTAGCDDLALLATADITGRIAPDIPTLLENVALFTEYAAEQGCLDRPYPFPSDAARFRYFRSGGSPDYDPYDVDRFDVVVMSGLPGAGKDSWVQGFLEGWPVVSLDAIRRASGVDAGAPQGSVVAAAYEQARVHLRARQSFVWNATNVTREMRSRCIDVCVRYGARVRLVSVEASESEIYGRNRVREERVPASVLERLIRRWETPDLTEAHTVEWVNTG